MNNFSLHFVKNKLLQSYVLIPLSMLIAVGLVFYPFGFNQVGLIEEWGILQVFDLKGPLYFITKYTHMPHHRMRPFTVLPHSIAYKLDPNSFFYWQFINFLLIWLKGVAMGFILWWIYPQRWIAIFGGALMILYPADTMQLPVRGIHINGSVALLLCGVALLLWATQSKKVWIQAILALLGSALFLCAGLMYETAFFLAPMPLLLWWVKYGLYEGWKTLKTQKFVIFTWVLAILIELGYYLWIGFDPDLFQSNISSSPESAAKLVFHNFHYLFTIGFYRTFLHSWYDAFHMLLTGGEWSSFLPIAILFILVLVFSLSIKTSATDSKVSHLNLGVFTRWFLVSLVITALGYLPYLVGPAYIFTTLRTYLFAGMGGVLCITVLIAVFHKRYRWLGAGMAGGFLLLGIAAQWTQFDHYKTLSDKQKTLLSGILRAAPRLNPNQKLLILDRTSSFGDVWMLRDSLLKSALNYLHGKDIKPVVCMEPGLIVSAFEAETRRCEEQKDAWQINKGLPIAFSLPKSQLVTVVIEQDGRTHASTTDFSSPPLTHREKKRRKKVLGDWQAKNSQRKIQKQSLPDRFTFDFGKWWGLEKQAPGGGWHSSEWIVSGWKPRSFAWIRNSKSTLHFHLSPQGELYKMQLGLVTFISDIAHQSLKVLVNGYPLQHNWVDGLHAEAEIDPTWLKEGFNELVFLTDIDPTSGLSLAVEYVNVVPQKRE